MGRVQAKGYTLPELLVSITLFGGLLTTVLSLFVTGQRSFFTSDSGLQAYQSVRSTLDAMAEDLAGAQIYSHCRGGGKFYVKFRRMSPSLVELGDSGQTPADDPNAADPLEGNGRREERFWEPLAAATPMRMYVWCPPGSQILDPCVQILNAPNVGTLPTGAGPLMLVRAAASNPNGENNAAWEFERLTAPSVTNFVVQLQALDSAGALTLVTEARFDCGAPTQNNTSEGCVNQRFFNPAGQVFQTAVSQVVRLDFRIQTASRTPQGWTMSANDEAIEGRVQLRNVQN